MRLFPLALLAFVAVVGVRTVTVSNRVARAAPSETPVGAGLSESRLRALLEVEDPGFYDHPGVDVMTAGSGWTTITQGLVKIHGYDDFEPGLLHWRKIEQSLAALLVNGRVAKDDQLQLFLDTAYLGTWEGRDVIGFADGARTYYGKSLPELSDGEFVGLVAMLAAPNAFHPLAHPEAHAERVRRIERLLAGACEPAGWRDVMYESCARDVAAR